MVYQSYQNEQLGRGATSQPIRHLIILIDGTWVSASRRAAIDRYSNIYKLGLYIETHSEASESQIAFYLPGIGSETSGLRLSNGIFATQLTLDVEKAYINICANYYFDEKDKVGDKIYIFGFSRGAVIARLVSGLIGKYGLLKPSQIEMFPYIWDDFIRKQPIQNVDDFRKKYCISYKDVIIDFMGLFDTVYGIYKGSEDARLKSIFFDNRILGKHVKSAIHILARDETRRVFRPVLFEGKGGSDQFLEQIWMPGVHSDVGGCYAEDFLGKVALMTMLDRIRQHSLLRIDFERSMSLRQSIEEGFGQNRIVVNDELQGVFRFWPAQWGGKRVPSRSDQNQSIHPIYKFLEGRKFVTKSKATKLFLTPDFPFEEYAVVDSLNNLSGRSL